jgi:uncharacterized protein (DUF2235 family)
MMKRIVLCSDGTGNRGGVSKDTNVWRIFTGVDKTVSQETQQIAYYDDGIGTQDFKLLKILGGAFGVGLSRNIRDLYAALAKNYEPGDEIYVFGFSRGAYTARVLCALICQVGVLKIPGDWSEREVRKNVREALRHHRDAYPMPIITGPLRRAYVRWKNTCKDSETFRKSMSHDGTWDEQGNKKLVEFVGVWDTVSAIGTPVWGLDTLINLLFYRIDFPDFALSHRVRRACHALAIDDERATFKPKLWSEIDTRTNVEKLNSASTDETGAVAEVEVPEIEQVWFSGVHSNVGGGYPKQGLAYASLAWIMKESGLRFKEGVLEQVKSSVNPNDKMYDSRSALAAYYRYAPREIDTWSRAATGVRAKVDGTTLERIDRAPAGYAPGNLPFDFDVVDTTGERAVAAYRTQQSIAERAEKDGYGSVTSLMSAKRTFIHLRKWLHGLLVTTTIFLVLTAYFPEGMADLLFGSCSLDSDAPDLAFISQAMAFLKVLLPDMMQPFLTSLDLLFRNYPWLFYGTLAWLTALYAVRHFLHRMTNGAYDEFWSNVRGDWHKK